VGSWAGIGVHKGQQGVEAWCLCMAWSVFLRGTWLCILGEVVRSDHPADRVHRGVHCTRAPCKRCGECRNDQKTPIHIVSFIRPIARSIILKNVTQD